MVKEETVLPQPKQSVKIHPIVQKPPPNQNQPIVAPGSTAIGTTPHSQHNSLPPQVSCMCYKLYCYSYEHVRIVLLPL